MANSFGYDCVQNGQISADSSNIIEDGSCNTDALNVNPRLGVLTNNGGLTLTHALPAGINQHCEEQLIDNLDQTGKRRDVGDACDIGSVEFLPATLFVVPLANGKTVIFEL